MPHTQLRILTLAVLVGMAGLAEPQPKELATESHTNTASFRIYSEQLDPREHPDYGRHPVRPPSWETFGDRTRFSGLRGFSVKDDRIVDYNQALNTYTRTYELGDVIWPSYPILFAENLDELAEEIARRELFLFDIWGYVPGSGPGGYWQQFEPPEGVFTMLESKLGEHWLGMDVGEQDGRYVGGYANQMTPASGTRFDQYLNLQRHFERMTTDLGSKMCTLLSLNFGHHFLKEGVYTLIGAETAQGLPNAQVYYSFIRGAGKQYGVLWFGNASVFNRWGWKVYGPERKAGGYTSGPTKGTSLSLLKRLLYSQILSNSVCVGFENSWFYADGELSPIGKIQQEARRWVRENGQPGTMLTPIGLMLDFYSGWSFPRHLYTGNVYRVWGNLPYEAGDYLTDGVLDTLYPGYQDSSYFRDERGFLTPTPYGDSADCLLSDAPSWLLDRYAVIVAASELSASEEIRDRLERYVDNGGHLVITAGNLLKFRAGIAGIRAPGPIVHRQKGSAVRYKGAAYVEQGDFGLAELEYPSSARVMARSNEVPAIVELAFGEGRITVAASLFGVPSGSVVEERISSEVEKPLAKPYPLLQHIRMLLGETFKRQTLFEAGEGLNWITCRKAPGEYVLGVCNDAYEQKPLQIVSHCGEILSNKEYALDQSEKEAVGYLPDSLTGTDMGTSGEGTIAGGDVRIFNLRIREEGVEPIPHRPPPPRPKGRILTLRNINSIKEAILARPTFFQHFDGVTVDWRYLRNRERHALAEEAGWIDRQGLRVIVDISPGINLYPDLRLIDNLEPDYGDSVESIHAVIEKMATLGARDLMLSLHRHPENNFTHEKTEAAFERTLRELCSFAEMHRVDLHLRVSLAKPPRSMSEAHALLEKIGAPNLYAAPSTALISDAELETGGPSEGRESKNGLWLVGTSADDIAGTRYSIHERIAGSASLERLGTILATDSDTPVVFDAIYRSQDEEVRDAMALQSIAD